MRTLFIALFVASVTSCGTGQLGPAGTGSDQTASATSRLAATSCFDAVLGQIDPKTGNVGGKQADPAQINKDLEACLKQAGIDPQANGSQSNSCQVSNNNGVCTVKSCVNGQCTETTVDTSKGEKCECKQTSGDPGQPGNPGNPGNPGQPGSPFDDIDWEKVGSSCPADGKCGKGLECLNPFGDKLPSEYAVCIPE